MSINTLIKFKVIKMQNNFSISCFNEYASDGISNALNKLNDKKLRPIFICIGSDLVLGDSLGPLVGTFLKNKNLPTYVYGTLNFPITAKEVEYARTYLKQTHPKTLSIAIDAAIGESGDIGLIRVLEKGLKPGLGVDKNLGTVGDLSIIGVVAEKSLKNYNLFNLTRLNLVYKMAEQIANGIEKYITSMHQENEYINAHYGT